MNYHIVANRHVSFLIEKHPFLRIVVSEFRCNAFHIIKDFLIAQGFFSDDARLEVFS